ncbi:TrmB family transcriptional regulator [Acidianus sp. RZ1]|uniref:TrmB family transcriptional regulator n=1 Tax=Acidianus sp. RZ1 TaxID=1540082 RepID=UPI0014928FD4|nr:helix-turn-helix domain-containing protein [Acidianus sp. RZ1]NON62280.1 TrmB family transcriptional regulator [Acidianus sp. RZ1]
MESEKTIKNLLKLGLTEYEARIYVILLKNCYMTMKDLSELSKVPYQRVYDVVKMLESKGLVKVIYRRPRKVKLIDPKIALPTYRDSIVNKDRFMY